MGRHNVPFDIRFWDRVTATDGCWVWTRGLSGGGYGHCWDNGSPVLAHRYSFERAYGPIPNGLHIDHLCRNRRCVRPDHLEAVSHKENVLRGVGAPAMNARKQRCRCGGAYELRSTGQRVCPNCSRSASLPTHCRQGHELRGGNVELLPNGQRNCVLCQIRKRARLADAMAENDVALLLAGDRLCRNGHERTPENMHAREGRTGRRFVCRICAKEKRRTVGPRKTRKDKSSTKLAAVTEVAK
jgi:hypothetical protein